MIVGGSDDDIMSGDALAAGTGAVALANNTATATGTGGDYGDLDVFAGAGNDMLGSDGGEGGQGDSVVGGGDDIIRSEEHTSELQSLMRISYAVFCLKNKTTHRQNEQAN